MMKSYKFHLKLSISLKKMFLEVLSLGQDFSTSTLLIFWGQIILLEAGHTLCIVGSLAASLNARNTCLLCVTNEKISRHCHESLEGHT